MNAFIRFNQGILGMPLPWQLWLVLLTALNAVVPLFYLGRVEARIVVAVMLFNVVLMTILTGLTGFTRLLGLGHFSWFPMLAWLWTRLEAIPADDFYGLWVRALIAVNTVSLAIDVVDVARYAAGDRKDTVSAL